MEVFACLIGFLYERLLFLVGLYHEGPPFLPPRWWDKLIWCDETRCSPRMWNMPKPRATIISGKSDSSLTSWVTAHWQFSAGRSIIFPKHAHLQQPREGGSVETTALRRCWLIHVCTVKKPWNQDQDPVFSCWSGSLFTVYFSTFSSSSFSFSFIFFQIKAFKQNSSLVWPLF